MVAIDRFLFEPRPDLAGGDQWRYVLALAYGLDGPEPAGAFASLHGARCLGATLADGEDRLIVRRGECDVDDWQRVRAALGTYRDSVEAVLTEASRGPSRAMAR